MIEPSQSAMIVAVVVVVVVVHIADMFELVIHLPVLILLK